METVDINDLKFINKISIGGYANIYKVTVNENEYAFKLFDDNTTLTDDVFFDKMSELGDLKIKQSLFPLFIVSKNNQKCGYLTKVVDSQDFSKLPLSTSIDKKIALLKNAKEALTEIHKNNIVHCDVHYGNFLIDGALLIDFDNCHFDNYYMDSIFFSHDAKEFVSKHGVIRELDIYMFNLMTFNILNNTFDKYKLIHGNYGVFDFPDAKRICKSLVLQKNNSDYLIDTLN